MTFLLSGKPSIINQSEHLKRSVNYNTHWQAGSLKLTREGIKFFQIHVNE